MAFTFDAKTSASATSTGLSVSHTCAAGADLLTSCIGVRGNQTVSKTYGGAALTSAVEKVDATDPERSAIFYKVNPATGANNLVVSLSGSVLHFVSIASWLADGTPSLDVTGSNSGASNTPSASVSGAVGTLAVDCCSTEDNASPPFSANGADQTVLHNTGTGSYGIGTSYELSPAANETFNWTSGAGGETWVHTVAVFKEAAAGTPIGRATETDTARPLAANQSKALGRAAEVNTARALGVSIAQALGRATELDSARALAAGQSRALGRAVETDTARPLSTGATLLDIGRALEVDVARPLTWSPQLVAVGRAAELDTARPLSVFVAGNVDVLLSDRRRRHRAAGLP